MNEFVCRNNRKRCSKTAEALKKRGFAAYVASSCEEAVALVRSLISPGEKIAAGGSVSLEESGVGALMRSGEYEFIDRSKAADRAQAEQLMREAFFCDTYFCSANAVTEDGVVYNVDGNANRVAAIAYGPKSVIMVVGRNKIVKDLDEAVARVKRIAAPVNADRLSCETYCAKAGECVSLKEKTAGMTDGCGSDARICCDYLVLANQRHKGRIKVILVDEVLGY